jgi:phosphoadenosine phosphosulfate reductase
MDSSEELYQMAIAMPFDRKDEKALAVIREYGQKMVDLFGFVPIAFSGGKDSIVVKDLVRRSGLPYRCFYAVTTIDPPELVHYIMEHHPDTKWIRPAKGTFFHRLAMKGPPSRLVRWCCAEYKESRIPYQWRVLGVRAEESKSRKQNWKVFTPFKDGSIVIAPVLYWTDADVWAYIRAKALPYCKLYDEGWSRLGCIGCPLAGVSQQIKEFRRWPGYARLWKRGVVRYYDAHHGKISRTKQPYWIDKPQQAACFTTGEGYFHWWLLSQRHTDDEAACVMGMF